MRENIKMSSRFLKNPPIKLLDDFRRDLESQPSFRAKRYLIQTFEITENTRVCEKKNADRMNLLSPHNTTPHHTTPPPPPPPNKTTIIAKV